MGKILDLLRVIGSWVTHLIDNIFNTSLSTVPHANAYGCLILGGVGLVLLAVLLVAIIVPIKKSKKKKLQVAKKEEEAPVEEKVDVLEENKEVEDHIIEETKVEEEVSTTVEETKVEEVEETPVDEPKIEDEEVKEEPVETVSTIIEEEEKPVEEVIIVPEEAKKEIEEKENKAVTKTKVAKTPAKKAPKKEEKPVKEPKVAQGKYVLIQEGPNWRYNLKASNGEVIIVSEPYSSEKAVRTGIETLKKNIELSRCEIVEDKHGLFSFRVITKQGRCLATSANYKTKLRAVSASESYKRWALSENIIVDEEGNTNHMEVEKVDINIEEALNGSYIIKESEHGYVYQLLAANKRVIATSQSYKSKETCLEAIEKFRVCVYDGSFYIYKDKNNKFQFKLYNKQNRLVLAGEVYDDKARVISVIEAIKRLARQAKVVLD